MLLENKDANYCATIVKINHLVPLPNMDNCNGFPVFGYQAIVRKDSVSLGQLGVLFTPETRLSEDFCKNNNLFRHSEKNLDNSKNGFIEDSRRIRAIRMRGNVSNALFMPLDSLKYLGIDTNDLKEGDCFTHINSVEICSKYVVQPKNPGPGNKVSVNGPVSKLRVEPKLIPEHVKTTFWLKIQESIADDEWIVVTQKLHGTSVRLAHQLCKKPLTYGQKWVKWFGIEVNDTEYDYFAGSRRVIKDNKRVDASNMQHYYKLDIYNQCLENVKTLIPKNTVMYGEIIGWAGAAAVQHNYTYNVDPGNFALYIYRIASVNIDGFSVDWSWDQIKDFCKATGLNHVPEIWQGKKENFNLNAYVDKKFNKIGLTQCLPLSDETTVDEGLVIRVNGINPKFYKFKSDLFYEHETKMLDKGIIDLESLES